MKLYRCESCGSIYIYALFMFVHKWSHIWYLGSYVWLSSLSFFNNMWVSNLRIWMQSQAFLTLCMLGPWVLQGEKVPFVKRHTCCQVKRCLLWKGTPFAKWKGAFCEKVSFVKRHLLPSEKVSFGTFSDFYIIEVKAHNHENIWNLIEWLQHPVRLSLRNPNNTLVHKPVSYP